MVAVNSIDSYPFFGFLRLSPRGYRNRYFLVALSRLILRRPNLEIVTKRVLHKQVKNTMAILVPCLHMEVHPYSYFWRCGYF